MKKVNLKIFFIATFVIILLNFLSWAGLQKNDYLNGSNSFWHVVASSWQILRFPLFTLFWNLLFGLNNFFVFSIAVFLNCAFYGVVIERIFYLFTHSSKFTIARKTPQS